MKKLSIGIQTFSEFIKNDYIYVDKTAIIHTLITTGKYYFLSRPRRFGKSLLVSTFADIFRGNRELFSGLAINSLPYNWKQYPVIIISFSSIPNKTPEILEQGIKNHLTNIATEHHITINEKLHPSEMLQIIVKTLSMHNPVVLLIDEYDYPILRHIHEPALAEQMRDILKDFYAAIKDLDPYLQFVFLTGISKFSKASIFSGLNNLQDISLDAQYNTLLSYTKSEITTHFEPYIHNTAQSNDCSRDQLLEKIKLWYDGYQFTDVKNAEKLYNPFSLLLFLAHKKFSNYWFETGTPTFLINLFKTKHYPIIDFEQVKASESDLGRFEIDAIELKTLLFQAGYLTIKSYDQNTKNYILGYPNKETIDGLSEYIIKSMTTLPSAHINDLISHSIHQ